MSSEGIIPDIQSEPPLVQMKVLPSRNGAVRGGCSKQRRKTLLQGDGGSQRCLWEHGWQGDMGAVLGPQGGTGHPRLPPPCPCSHS